MWLFVPKILLKYSGTTKTPLWRPVLLSWRKMGQGQCLKYILNTPDRGKQKQLCHINMLKEYVDRDSTNIAPIIVITQSLNNKMK